jgi:hypothetical protein
MRYYKILRSYGILSLIAASLFLGSTSNAYELAAASVRYYKYEDGSTKNLLYFEIKDDEGNFVNDGSIVTGVELWDPSEIEVDLDTVTFTPLFEFIYGKFDLGTDQFIYYPSEQLSSFEAKINDPLIGGTYELVVTTDEGPLPTANINFDQQIELPFVFSRSFQFHPDPSENIYWMWDISQELLDMANSYSTWVAAMVGATNNDKLEFLLYVRVPTYMGFLFIPNSVVQQIPGGLSEYYYRILVRTSDGTNRANSEKLIVNDPLITVPKKDCSKGDLDFDEDVDGNDLSIFSEYFGTILLQP